MPPPRSIKRILRHNRAQIIEAGRAARNRLAAPVSPSAAAHAGDVTSLLGRGSEENGDSAVPRLEVIQSSILFRHGDRSPPLSDRFCKKSEKIRKNRKHIEKVGKYPNKLILG